MERILRHHNETNIIYYIFGIPVEVLIKLVEGVSYKSLGSIFETVFKFELSKN